MSDQRRIWFPISIVAVTAFLLFWLVRVVWRTFQEIETQLAAALIAGSMTVLVSVLSITLTQRAARKERLRADIQEKKKPTYSEFINLWMALFGSVGSGKESAGENSEEKTREDLVRDLMGMSPKLMTWASDEVIQRWGALRERMDLLQVAGERILPLLEFEDLIVAMRKDLDLPCRSGGSDTMEPSR